MIINSNYENIGDEIIYNSFTCELNSDTILKFELIDKECKIIMEDKVSGVIDISANVNSDDIKSLVRTLRIVASQLDKK